MNKKELVVYLNKEIKKLNIKIDKLILNDKYLSKEYQELCKIHTKRVDLLNKLSN